ncbi:MAG: ComEC/Rec2 family competence protein [Bdellovibrionales bacterium]
MLNETSSRLRNYLKDELESVRGGLWAPVCLGIGVAAYFNMPGVPHVILAGTMLLLAVAGMILRQRRTAPLGAAALLLLCAGFLAAHVETVWQGTAMTTRDLGVKTVTALVEDIQPTDSGSRIILRDVVVQELPAKDTPQKIRLNYRLKDPLPPVGARVQCDAAIKPIPGAVIPGAYDFRRHFFFQGIGATGFVVKPCQVTDQPATRSFGVAVADARNDLRMTIRANLQGDEAAIAEALMTGIQEGITDETMHAMRASGLVHILSVSGLHIGLAAGIVFVVLRALLALFPFITLRYPIKKWAAISALLSAWAYTIFVGAPIPAVRACLMTSLMLLAVLLDRQALSLRVVALAASAILLFNPSSLLNPSFQLSFAAVTAIIAMIEASEPWRRSVLAERPWFMRALFYVAGLAVTSLVASIATLPFTYYHFQQMNLYGVVANMLAGPLTSFWLMPLAMLSFLLAPVGWAGPALMLLGDGIQLLIDIATGVAAWPGADWWVPAMPYAALTCITLGALWFIIWQRPLRWVGISLVLLGILLTVVHERPLALIDGQGRYVVFRKDNSDNYVLMAGPRVKQTNFTLQQWKRYLGVQEFVLAKDSKQCDGTGCVASGIDILRDANALAVKCPERLVLTNARAARNCPALIDSSDLYFDGAHRIEMDGTTNSMRSAAGYWPWRL